jgi:cytochrome c oxidase subunit IV
MRRVEASTVLTDLLVGLGLLILLAATYLLSFAPLGVKGPVVAFGLAVAKMLLIAAFYMHLRRDRAVMWTIALTAFFLLAVLIGLSLGDIVTRDLPP